MGAARCAGPVLVAADSIGGSGTFTASLVEAALGRAHATGSLAEGVGLLTLTVLGEGGIVKPRDGTGFFKHGRQIVRIRKSFIGIEGVGARAAVAPRAGEHRAEVGRPVAEQVEHLLRRGEEDILPGRATGRGLGTPGRILQLYSICSMMPIAKPKNSVCKQLQRNP